jgi:hypothetical protein
MGRWSILFCFLTCSPSVSAQDAQIDLDTLSKISYCVGVFESEEQSEYQAAKSLNYMSCELRTKPICNDQSRRSDPGLCDRVDDTRRMEYETCLSTQRSIEDTKNRIARFNSYILPRIMYSDSAFFSALSAKNTGIADSYECLQKSMAVARGCTGRIGRNFVDCIEAIPTGPCHRTSVCMHRELPY